MGDHNNSWYKCYKFFWLLRLRNAARWEVFGPFCPKCRTELTRWGKIGEYVCPNPNCDTKYTLDAVEYKREVVKKLFIANRRKDFEVVSLDLPVGRVVESASDENYWIDARMGQDSAKKSGMILFGDRSKGENNKAQIFVDFDEEEVRFHSKDAHPTDVACKVTIEFPNTKTTIEKK